MYDVVDSNYTDYGGTFDSASTNNYSSDTTAPDNSGANPSYENKTLSDVDFVSTTSGSEDLHLQSTSDAKDNWSNVYADGNLAVIDDIDGAGRPNSSLGDIGADEYPISIFRSVGPSASSALETGTGNDLTISGSTATFTIDLGDDVGVGDAIQYDTAGAGADPIDAICFIHGRTDETHYTVKNSLGGAPTATIADQDWSIFRSYDSLSHAESGDENDAINDTVETFENWAAGKDIVTSNEQWNIACYNGQGDAADQTAVTINDWTTGENNYIKVYTPTETSEVGTTQRHDGKWNTGKYRLTDASANVILTNNEAYVRIKGLQIDCQYYSGSGWLHGIENNSNGLSNVEVHISHNIVRQTYSATTPDGGFAIVAMDNFAGADADCVAKVWNNLCYDFTANSAYGGSIYTENEGTLYLYNNTFVGGVRGVFAGSASVNYVKNNISIDATFLDFSGTYHADSTNNCSEDDSAPGSNPQTGSEPTFVNKAGKDFHLASNDTGAKDYGDDLSSDTYLPFSDDIDGETRLSPYWDIGADEYPASRKVRFEGDFKMEGDFKIE